MAQGVEVRDSLDPHGPRLRFASAPWHAFLAWAATDDGAARHLHA